jgi:hypothetical protein
LGHTFSAISQSAFSAQTKRGKPHKDGRFYDHLGCFLCLGCNCSEHF